jgi:hypothetical protein
MAEKHKQKQQGPRLANDNGLPNGVSLNPRILRIACATPKEDCKVRQILPAFAHVGSHGTESQSPARRDNSLIFTESRSPYYMQSGEHHPTPARMQPTGEDKRTAEDRPTCDYLETTRTFWQPYAERELTREDAREMAHNLIGFFTVLREWTLRERERGKCGVVGRASSPPPRKRGRLRTRAAARDKMQS